MLGGKVHLAVGRVPLRGQEPGQGCLPWLKQSGEVLRPYVAQAAGTDIFPKGVAAGPRVRVAHAGWQQELAQHFLRCPSLRL